MKNKARQKKKGGPSDEKMALAINTDALVLDAAIFAAEFQDPSTNPENIHLGLRIDSLKLLYQTKSHFRYKITSSFPSSLFRKYGLFEAAITSIEQGLTKNPTLQQVADDIKAAIQEAFGTVGT